MNTTVSKSQDSKGWRGLYRAALYELDTNRLPERIAVAEKALVTRARELFRAPGDNIEGEQVFDDAMYALHTLRSTLKCSPTHRTMEFEHLKTA